MKLHPSPRRLWAACLCGWISLAGLCAADWPQWRGPDRTGHTAEPLPATLPAEASVRWRLPVGHGYASPVVASGRVVVLDDVGGVETAHAVDAVTGRRLWATPLGESFADEFEPGPRCTPVVSGDRVFAQTTKGELRCLRLDDGRTVWRTNFADFGVVWNSERNTGLGAANRRGNTGSPIVRGDRVLVQVGSTQGASIVAFEAATGRELWRSQNDQTTYSSPSMATLAGRPQFVAATCEGLLALSPDDGAVLWRVPFKTIANRNVLTPLLLDDTVYFASHSTGLRALRVETADGVVRPREAWLNRDLKINLSTPVAVGGHLYGLGAAKDYVCVDRSTGRVAWSQPGFGDVASTIASGSRLLVMTEVGEIRLLAATPERYDELGRLQVCGKTYSHPAFSDGVIYVRDPRELQAVVLDGSRTP